MYYVENGHEPIISKEIYDAVQEKLGRTGQRNVTTLVFSRKLYCSDCVGIFGPVPTHSTTYNDIVWKCGNRHLRRYPCTTPALYEELLKPIFHEIILSVLAQHPGVIRDCIVALKAVSNGLTAFSKKIISDALTAYDINTVAEHRIWRSVIQKVVVHPGHILHFHIIDGTVITHQMMRTSPRRSRLPPTTKAEILQAHSNGQGAAGIASTLDVAQSSVRSLLHRSEKSATDRAKIAVCQNCGQPFLHSGNKGRKYCSQKCYRERRFHKSR